MPKITVWECPYSKQLFRTEAEYKAYEQKKKVDRAKLELALIESAAAKEKMSGLYQCSTLNEIEDWLKANWLFLAEQSQYGRGKGAVTPQSISFQGMAYSNRVSNSHSAPSGRKQNWGSRNSKLPTGYAGWSGTLYVVFGQEPNVYATDVIRTTKIYTGTGGGASSFRAEVRVWAEDFPNMVEAQDRYPYMVPLDGAEEIDLSDERIVKLNDLMIGGDNQHNIHPAARVCYWLNNNCGKRQRMWSGYGAPPTWHFFKYEEEPYVFVNTLENAERFKEQFLAYENNWALLKTLPRKPYMLSLNHHTKKKLGERSYVGGCWTTDNVEFETLGEVFEFNSFKLFSNRDDFTLFKIQADNIEV